MKLTGKTLLFFALLFSSSLVEAQNWIKPWIKGDDNFYTIRDAYYREERREEKRRARRQGEKEDEGAWMHFKRWEYIMAPRVYPSGDLSLPSTNYERFSEYLQQNPAARAQLSAARLSNPSTQSFNWSFVGPTGAPNGGGAGRINAVRFDPQNPNTLYACAPAGGLWKSINGGQNWTTNNDFLALIGCSDVAIDPTNTQIMYLATGDGDAGDTRSIGVLKSTDGGLSWNPTGLVWTPSQAKRINKLLIDPTNPSVLYAATNAGVYKTSDAAATWVLTTSVGANDIEFQPGNTNTLYISGTRFYRSQNAGNSWVLMTTGLPQGNQVSRLAIGVTPANPFVVYVLAGAAASGYGFQGIYKSTDGGTTFTQQANSPNLLGWDPNGNDTDGQAWYTLSIAVSPVDENVLITGGVNIWFSDNGGLSWQLNAHWYGGGGAPYVHADIHDLIFAPNSGSDFYAGCDGGVFTTNNGGASWNDISGDMGIAQIYSIGISASNAGMLIGGHQDNGTNLKNGSSYDEVLGGDGMVAFIDWSNNSNMFGELYYGDFNRSTNGGGSFQGITNGLTGSAAWVTPWLQDPVDPNTLYAGYDQVFKSTNLGTSWTQIGTVSTGQLTDIVVAPSNTQVIYAASGTQLVRTSDGGQNWTIITNGLPISQASITRLAVSDHDPDHLWVTFSGYNAAAKVYTSSDGGQTWSNISAGLPNLPVNCIVYQPASSSDQVFVGCDVGVYFFSNNSGGWQPYFTGLPHAPVHDLEIFKPTWKLRAATYGRGVWECSIDTSALAPLADFAANITTACPGQTITLTDLSTMNASSWNWSMPGATPSTSSAQNPSITYAAPGVYPVTLVASNGNGSSSEIKNSYIYIGGTQQPPLVEGFVSSSFLPTGWSGMNSTPQNVYWQRSGSTGHNSSESAYFDNFNNNVNGAQDDFRTQQLNLTGYTSVSLAFDVAYCRYNSSRSDTLEVLVSTDCGQTFTQVYLKGGTLLSTKSDQTSAFTPTNSQWRTESVSLNSFAGNSSLLVAFRNHGRHGQFLYLDNINISGTSNAAPVANFMSNPVSICVNAPAGFTDLSSAIPTTWSWIFNGANTTTSTQQSPSGIVWSTPGTYTVSLVASNGNGSDSIAQTVTVLPAPVADAGSDTAICLNSTVQLSASGGIGFAWTPVTSLSNPNIAAPIAAPTDTTVYSVTVTDINGCSAVDSVHVFTVHPPTFTVTAPSNICPGDTTLLVCSNPNYTYVWSALPTMFPTTGDSVYVFPQATTPYIVTATDTTGCTSTVVRNVSTYPPVQAPTISVNGNVLTSSSATGNQWYLNGVAIPGATSQSYTASGQGIYTVVVTTSAGCSSQASLAVIISVEELSNNPFGLNIVPNPNNGQFALQFEAVRNETIVVEIFNSIGQRVFLQTLENFSGAYAQQVDLAPKGAGTYLVRVSGGKGQSTRTLIVK